MSKGLPSLAALLGLVAVAGYQNRDKIGEFVKGLAASHPGSAAGGLGELVDKFTKNGQGDVAKSWVDAGPNAPINEPTLEKTLGGDMIDNLAKQTGLSREELLTRLAKLLPEAVDKMTPDGRLPA
jgi:uncharacterized protein YidB (DUF937 family)